MPQNPLYDTPSIYPYSRSLPPNPNDPVHKSPGLNGLVNSLFRPKPNRPPVINADGVSGPATVTGGARTEDIDLPPDSTYRINSGWPPASDQEPNPPASITAASPAPPPSISHVRPDPGPALRSLQTLDQNDPTSELYQLQQERASEAEDRIFANQRASAWSPDPGEAAGYGGEVGALKGLLGRYQHDIAENPITQQLGEANDYRKQEREAILGGFGGGSTQRGVYQNPIQAANQSAREMETAKINAPVEAQRMAGQFGLAQEQEKQRGAMAVQGSRGAQAEAALNAFLQAQASGASTNQLRSYNPQSGAFTVAPPQRPESMNPLLRELTATRQAVEVARQKSASFLGKLNPVDQRNLGTAEATYKQALGNVFGRSLASDNVKEIAAQAITDPELSGLPAEQLLQQLENDDGSPIRLSPQELQQLNELLNYGRGLVTGGQ